MAKYTSSKKRNETPFPARPEGPAIWQERLEGARKFMEDNYATRISKVRRLISERPQPQASQVLEHSRPRLNLYSPHIQSLVAQLYPAAPRVRLSVNPRAAAEISAEAVGAMRFRADAATSALRYQVREIPDADRTIRGLVRDAAYFDVGWLKFGIGSAMELALRDHNILVSEEKLSWEKLGFYDVLFDPTAKSFPRLTWIGERVILSEDQARASKYLKNAERIVGRSMSDLTQNREYDESFLDYSKVGNEKFVVIHICQYKIDPDDRNRLFLKLPEDEQALYHSIAREKLPPGMAPTDEQAAAEAPDYAFCIVGEEHAQFLREPELSPYLCEDFNILPLVLNDPVEGLVGESEYAKWEFQHQAIQDLFGAIVEISTRQIPFVEVNMQRLQTESELKKMAKGIPFRFIKTKGDGSAFSVVAPPGVSQEMVAVFQLVQNLIEHITGNVQPSTLNPQTASAVNAIVETTSTRLLHRRFNIRDFLVRLYRNSLQLLQSPIGPDRFARVIERDPVTGQEVVFDKPISKSDIQGEFDLAIELESADPADPAVQVNQLQNLWALFGNFMESKGKAAIAEKIMRAMHVEEDLLSTVKRSMEIKEQQDVAAQSAGAEGAAGQNGAIDQSALQGGDARGTRAFGPRG